MQNAMRIALVALMCTTFGLSIRVQEAKADEITDLDNMYAAMVSLEGYLLEEQRRVRGVLNAEDALLIRLPDGTITAVPRAQVRDVAGQAFDWATHWDVQSALSPFLPDRINAILSHPLGRAGGRIEAADMAVSAWRARQGPLRDALVHDLGQIEARLEDVRTIAAAAIAQRDAQTAARDRIGVIDLRPCLDPNDPVDGEALVASIGYGGAKYPAKGPFICLGPNRFLWDSGHTMREFRCNSPTDCFLYSEMAYKTDKHPETGNTIYRLEDQRTSVTFFYK